MKRSGASAGAGRTSSNATPGVAAVVCATGLANSAGTGVIDIPNYSGSTFFKNVVARASQNDGAANTLLNDTFTGLWVNTAAITSIVIGIDGGGNFITGSTFTLYGY